MIGASIVHRAWCLALCLICCLGWTPPAQAHKPSDSYLNVTLLDGGRVALRWDIALRDLDSELALDRDGDGRLTWGEVRHRWADILGQTRPYLTLQVGEQPCTPLQVLPDGDGAQALLVSHTDGRYAVLVWEVQCPTAARASALRLGYRLFALTDPMHRGIVRWRQTGAHQAGEAGVLMLGGERAEADLPWSIAGDASLPVPPASAADDGRRGAGTQPNLTDASPVSPNASPRAAFASFVVEGLHHIVEGADHVLFLLSLTLVAVWWRPGHAPRRRPLAAWVPRARWGSAMAEVGKLVTAFTVAHSITLSLSVAGVLAPPTQWVESLIALSVLLAAIDNLWPLLPGPRWPVVFGFGLVHGFGFAGALQDLSLSGRELVSPLLGFNLGVEAGQLLIVGCALPVAYGLRSSAAYRRWAVGGGSLAIASLACVWLVERVFNVSVWAPPV